MSWMKNIQIMKMEIQPNLFNIQNNNLRFHNLNFVYNKDKAITSFRINNQMKKIANNIIIIIKYKIK